MGIISKKLRDSARGQECTFNIPGHCTGGVETTCLCHAPSEIKGMGTKSPDYFAAFGCFECHRVMDEHRLPREEERFYWLRAIERTWRVWIERGLVIIPVDPETAKRRPKKPSNLPKGRKIQSRNDLRRKERV